MDITSSTINRLDRMVCLQRDFATSSPSRIHSLYFRFSAPGAIILPCVEEMFGSLARLFGRLSSTITFSLIRILVEKADEELHLGSFKEDVQIMGRDLLRLIGALFIATLSITAVVDPSLPERLSAGFSVRSPQAIGDGLVPTIDWHTNPVVIRDMRGLTRLTVVPAIVTAVVARTFNALSAWFKLMSETHIELLERQFIRKEEVTALDHIQFVGAVVIPPFTFAPWLIKTVAIALLSPVGIVAPTYLKSLYERCHLINPPVVNS